VDAGCRERIELGGEDHLMIAFCDGGDHYDQDAYMMLKWNVNEGGAHSVAAGREGRGFRGGLGLGKTLYYQSAWVVGFAGYISGPSSGWSVTSGLIYECSATNEVPLFQVFIGNDKSLNLGAPGGTWATSGPNFLSANVWNYYEFKFSFSNGGPPLFPIIGSATARLNSDPVTDFSGSGVTGHYISDTLLGIPEANFHKLIEPGGNLGFINDDLYIADQSGVGSVNDFAGLKSPPALVPGIVLGALFPISDVSTGGWTQVGGPGGLWAAMNDQFAETNDDSIYINANTTGNAWRCKFATANPLYQISCVHYGNFNRKTGESSRSVQQSIRGNPRGNAWQPTDTYKYDFNAYDQDPMTGAPWTIANFDAADFGLGITH